MYRSCIFCSAALGSNDAIERFPVGRTLAFDGEKGRLWAVCPRCARWNLAPLEERWEAIEDAERLFRDARLRVQSEKIGIARLRDGSKLIRVGEALAGELAAWRYGESLTRRRMRHALWTGAAALAIGTVYVTGLVAGGIGVSLANALANGGNLVKAGLAERRVVARVPGTGNDGGVLRWKQVRRAVVALDREGQVAVRIPGFVPQLFATKGDWRDWTVQGPQAMHLLARAMPLVNATGARRTTLDQAVRILEATSPAQYVQAAARTGFPLAARKRAPVERLAFEMALHEESERRAMEGELAALQAAWREAEQIAAIADALPDSLTNGRR